MRGDDTGGGIEDVGDAARGKAAGQEAVMDMAAVPAKDGLATEKAPRDGEGGIEERDGQRNEGSGHAEQRGRFWDQMMPKHPRRKPMLRLPESPRKIEAGLML